MPWSQRAVVSTIVGGMAFAAALGAVTASQPPASQPAAPPQPPAGAAPANPADIGYSVGFDVGREVRTSLSADGVTADTEAVLRGFADGLKNAAPAIPENRISKILADLQKALDERRVNERLQSDPVFRASADQAAARSTVFLKRFAERPGVLTLPGGIAYQVVRAGTGAAGTDGTAFVVNYQAFLTTNESVAQGQGVTVNADQVLPGALTVLKAMRAGDRWYVALPPEVAYGVSGHQPGIGPNEALVVDVELLEVKR